MTIQQDIDKLFRAGLSEYSENPPRFAWDAIEQRLNKKRARWKRNLMYSVAASITILLSFGAGHLFTNIKSNNQIVITNIQEPPVVEPTSESTVGVSFESEKVEPNTNNIKKNNKSDAGIFKKTSKEFVEPKTNNKEKGFDDSNKPKVKKVNSSGTLLPPMFASMDEYQVIETLHGEERSNLKPMKSKGLPSTCESFIRELKLP